LVFSQGSLYDRASARRILWQWEAALQPCKYISNGGSHVKYFCINFYPSLHGAAIRFSPPFAFTNANHLLRFALGLADGVVSSSASILDRWRRRTAQHN